MACFHATNVVPLQTQSLHLLSVRASRADSYLRSRYPGVPALALGHVFPDVEGLPYSAACFNLYGMLGGLWRVSRKQL
jgi:hypothetical protein